MYNPMDLTGKRILVTGASSGLGQSTAAMLSRLGADVILVGRDEARLETTLASLTGGNHNCFLTELTHIEGIPEWLKSVASEVGVLDGLVHSAGVNFVKPLRGTKYAEYDDLMKVNIDSAYFLAKGFRHRAVCRKPASIVFLSSVSGIVGVPGLSAYSASKGAVIALCRSLAVELASENVRVNCISPGYIETEMTSSLEKAFTKDQVAALEKAHPFGFGKPEDVAHMVAYLLADTGKWITGANLVVDGGMTA